MAEFMNGSGAIPVDPNSTLKTVMVLAIGAATLSWSIGVLMKNSRGGRAVVSVILVLGTALALWSFFAN